MTAASAAVAGNGSLAGRNLPGPLERAQPFDQTPTNKRSNGGALLFQRAWPYDTLR
ncbi:hypothetical protein AURDEDRAFT_163994 [Auricularia subglabra TFB-10046 SS5]|nr:hypothetical protein AURDEDRAFT_163994 [Auricularia subglabra TFB-10046 SS5]